MELERQGERRRRPSGRQREGYTPYRFTIADRLADGWFSGADAAVMERVATMTVGGESLRDRPWRLRNDSVHDPRIVARDAELFGAARTLALLGARDVALTQGEAPDLVARFSDGRQVRIEVSEVIHPASARFANAIADLELALRHAVDDDETARPRRLIITFVFGALVSAAPDRREREALVSELLAILRAAPRATRGRAVDGATARRFDMWMVVAEADLPDGIVTIQPPAFTFRGDALVEVALDRLLVKRRLQYSGDGPLWLVLPITDQRGVFHETLDAFAALALEIAPFQRVILEYNQRLAVHDAVGEAS